MLLPEGKKQTRQKQKTAQTKRRRRRGRGREGGKKRERDGHPRTSARTRLHNEQGSHFYSGLKEGGGGRILLATQSSLLLLLRAGSEHSNRQVRSNCFLFSFSNCSSREYTHACTQKGTSSGV